MVDSGAQVCTRKSTPSPWGTVGAGNHRMHYGTPGVCCRWGLQLVPRHRELPGVGGGLTICGNVSVMHTCKGTATCTAQQAIWRVKVSQSSVWSEPESVWGELESKSGQSRRARVQIWSAEVRKSTG